MRNAINNGQKKIPKAKTISSNWTMKVSIWVVGIGKINKGWAKATLYVKINK